MNRLEALLRRIGLNWLLHAAILCTLSSLAVMVAMTLYPNALLLVLGMGGAHALGILGVLLFGASVLREMLPPLAARLSGAPRPPQSGAPPQPAAQAQQAPSVPPVPPSDQSAGK